MKQQKYLFLVVISQLIVFQSVAQLLNTKNGSLFADQPFFNDEVVHDAKIKRIVGEYSYKKVGEPIQATKEIYALEFDKTGRMLSTVETRKNDGTKDSNWVIFSYTATGQIKNTKKGKKESLAGKQFNFNNQGICDEEITFVEIKKKEAIIKEILYVETIKINLGPNKVQRIYFNNYTLPYLTETTHLDSTGKMIEKVEEFTVSQQTTTTRFAYSEKGYLTSITKITSEPAAKNEEIRYQYDEKGNVTEQLNFENGSLTTETSFLYNATTQYLVNLIQRNVANNSLVLIRFKPYEFFL
jgi:YD repeat-containing protein